MEHYKPNSNKAKDGRAISSAPEKKVEKIITGEAKTKKKNDARRFADAFISEEIHNIKTNIIFDVLVPAIKNAIWESVTKGIEMLLFPNGEFSPFKKSFPGSRISYERQYERANNRGNYQAPLNRAGIGYNLYDITLPSRGDAEAVLSGMYDIIETYRFASVADLYDLVGVTGNYTDNDYGWTNISNASVVRVRNGYLLKMPKALPLN